MTRVRRSTVLSRGRRLGAAAATAALVSSLLLSGTVAASAAPEEEPAAPVEVVAEATGAGQPAAAPPAGETAGVGGSATPGAQPSPTSGAAGGDGPETGAEASAEHAATETPEPETPEPETSESEMPGPEQPPADVARDDTAGEPADAAASASPVAPGTTVPSEDRTTASSSPQAGAAPGKAAPPAPGSPKAVSNEIAPGTAQIVNVRFEAVRMIQVVSYGAPDIRIQTIDPNDHVTFTTQGGLTTIHLVEDEGRLLPSGVWRVEFHNDGDEPARVAYEISSQRAAVELIPQGFPPEAGLAVGTRALLNGEPMPDGTLATAVVTAADGSTRSAPLHRAQGAQDWRADFPDAAPGVYVVRTLFDVDGLRSSVAFTVVAGEPERVPPALELLTVPAASNARGWFARDVEVTIRASDAGSGVAQLEWRVDAEEPRTTDESVAVFGLSHGEHTIEYRAVDRLGNETGLRTREIRIDTVAPGIDVQVPVEGGEYVRGSAHTVSFACEDDLSGIYECTSATPHGGPLDTTYPGEYTIRVSAIDRAGNLTQRDVSYRVVEPPLPTVGISMPEPQGFEGWYTSRPVFGLEALEGNLDVASLHWRYAIDGGEPVEVQRDGPRAAFSPPQDGAYEFTYWAVTRDGRVVLPQTVTFRVDTTPPVIDVRAPRGADPAAAVLAPGQYRQGDELIADYACDDETSGLAECRGTVASGASLPTDVPGEREFVVEATDAAGNTARAVVAYAIVPAPAPGEQPGEDPGEDPVDPDPVDPDPVDPDPAGDPRPGDPVPAADDPDGPDVLAVTGTGIPWALAVAGILLAAGGWMILRRRHG
ncbi:OmpL47-type beta-barrel domain-containing protein [Microbacterium sp. NPDC003461]